MKRLGTILHIIDNLLIVRADKTLKKGDLFENSTVVTKNMKKIGRIKEFFGPVNAPYISIRIFRETKGFEFAKMRNERVYLA